MRKFRVAAIQFEPRLGEVESNRQRMLDLTERAAGRGCQLIVLPEMATTGYCFIDRAEIAPLLETIPGPTTQLLSQIAQRHGCHIVVGLGEVERESGLFYNSAVLIRPDGGTEKSRKVHPFVSDTRWANDGDLGFPAWDTALGRISVIICMDAGFFESSRIPCLAGAEVICMPTNWVQERAPAMDWFTRAVENSVYLIAADRYGEERGVQFSGGSCIIGPRGDLLAWLDTGDGIVEAEIDPGVVGRDRSGAGALGAHLPRRRPEFYGDLLLNPLLWEMRLARDLYGHSPLPEGRQFAAAVVQCEQLPHRDSQFKSVLDECISQAAGEIGERPGLVVLPELTCTTEPGQAGAQAESLSGPTSKWAQEIAEKHDLYLVLGLAELDGEDKYNTAILMGPEGLIGRYRKVHLNDADLTWASPGDEPFRYWDLPIGRVSMLIGTDLLLPEPARVLAMQGVDLICAPSAMSSPRPLDLAPTRVPLAKEILQRPDVGYWHLWRNRAAENNVYLAFANRADQESMGCSGIFGPDAFEFPLRESVLLGKQDRTAWLSIDTRDYPAPGLPNPARFKPMIRMRKPWHYHRLVAGEVRPEG
ncbi:MAG: hypothetical protein A2W26_00765 [Acidobacteria bacterium RBG_16_64_8]|nr:MAG: hypothetical protein A2W26_00765 [Acidobacteria bacterium RBG_16_64_8]